MNREVLEYRDCGCTWIAQMGLVFWEVGDCTVHVECDEGCGALQEPATLEEYQAALVHWRSHGYACGCSHGC